MLLLLLSQEEEENMGDVDLWSLSEENTCLTVNARWLQHLQVSSRALLWINVQNSSVSLVTRLHMNNTLVRSHQCTMHILFTCISRKATRGSSYAIGGWNTGVKDN